MRARIPLLLLGTLCALALAEVSARAFGLSKTWQSYLASRDVNRPEQFTGGPLGFRRVPGRSWSMPFGQTVTANARGFRDEEFTVPKPVGILRVAFLGDFVTEGYGVALGQRFSDVAKRDLCLRGRRRYEVLNFGVAGHATADQYLVLREHVLDHVPDLVVLQVAWNDFARNAQKLPLLEAPASEAPRTAGPTPEPPSPAFKVFLQRHSAFYLAVAERASVLRLRRGGSSSVLDNVLATSTEAWESTRRILGRFVELCRAHGIGVLVLYVPMDVEVQAGDTAKATVTRSRLREISEVQPAVVFVDVLDVLRRNRDRSLYLDDIHLTVEGHRIVGEAIARAILER